MPRRRKARPVRFAEPKFSDGVYYAILIGLIATFISGAYYKGIPCQMECIGENISNGYPYPWFTYNTYEGWQRGNIVWVGAVIDIAFWAFIAYLVMLILYAAMKEVR
ncbi:MAG: hypothetical protein QXF56_03710 [Candidatus Micrarchaeia archaeon]